MDKLTRQIEYEKFQDWWLREGKHCLPIYNIETRYWAWKAWEERASEQVIENERKEKEYYYNESIVQDNVTEALEKHAGDNSDVCPKCGSSIGHYPNCPDGICFISQPGVNAKIKQYDALAEKVKRSDPFAV